MSDSDAGWLAAGGVIGAVLTGVATLTKAFRADPNKTLDVKVAERTLSVEEKKLDIAADEQEAQQAERAADALLELLRETRSMLADERVARREWQDIARSLQDSNLALRNEVEGLRDEVHALRLEVADKATLRRELEETKQILATYRAQEKQQ